MFDLSLDGGGTKMNALLFDERFQVVARGRGRGVNTTQNSPEQAEEHVRECLEQALPEGLTELGTVYVVFVGDARMLERVLRERVPKIGRIVFFGEDVSGLLAGSGRRTGVLALAGTGADGFHIHPDHTTVIGALGPVLGDQGGGAWIGLQAVRAVGRDFYGWGEKTLLTRLVMEHFSADGDIWKVVDGVHSNGRPFTKVAPLAPLVGQAAASGDHVALEILTRAGYLMGVQLNALLRRDPLLPDEDTVTLCGGAWKSHPVMLESFERELHREHPELRVQKPWFEHVVAGPMDKALKAGMTREAAYELLSRSCDRECLNPFEG